MIIDSLRKEDAPYIGEICDYLTSQRLITVLKNREEENVDNDCTRLVAIGSSEEVKRAISGLQRSLDIGIDPFPQRASDGFSYIIYKPIDFDRLPKKGRSTGYFSINVKNTTVLLCFGVPLYMGNIYDPFQI